MPDEIIKSSQISCHCPCNLNLYTFYCMMEYIVQVSPSAMYKSSCTEGNCLNTRTYEYRQCCLNGYQKKSRDICEQMHNVPLAWVPVVTSHTHNNSCAACTCAARNYIHKTTWFFAELHEILRELTVFRSFMGFREVSRNFNTFRGMYRVFHGIFT